MKKILVTLIAISLTFITVACSGGGKYADGAYTSEAKGNGGNIKLEVKIASGKISTVNILDNHETPEMISSVKDGLIPQIIKKQGTEGIDAVSGATNSSKAVLKAVAQVLEEHKK
jgi:uncharacterized protein with FMN-binding domain